MHPKKVCANEIEYCRIEALNCQERIIRDI